MIDKGYDLGNYGPNKDGVDGKFGDATLAAYAKEMDKNLGKYEQKDLSGELKKKSCDSEWGCAAYVSHATDFAALGHAWTMLGKLKKQNKNVKFNIYNDPKFKNVNKSNLISTTKLVKKNLKAKKEMFAMGDAVGLFLPSSTNNQKALKEGDGTYNSHVGLVTGFKPDGTPIVTHNIYGTLHHDAFNTLNIAWIAETGARDSVKYDDKTNVDEKGNEPSSAVENIQYYSKNMTKDMATGTLDAEQVANDVYGILGTESKFGTLAPTEEDLASTQFKRKAYGLVDKGVKANRSNISTGAAKIKLATLSNKEQRFLGLNSASDLKSMKNSVKVATYLYIKRHNYFDEYAKKNPQLKLTPQDVQALTILSHNQGDSRLKNFGYNKKGAYFSESVKALRDLQEGKVKDITSTKYKYANLIPGLGDVLYDASLAYAGEKYGKDPYIKKVNYHGAKLPEVKKLMKSGKTEEEAKEIVRKNFYKKKLKEDKKWEQKKFLEENEEQINKKFGFDKKVIT